MAAVCFLHKPLTPIINPNHTTSPKSVHHKAPRLHFSSVSNISIRNAGGGRSRSHLSVVNELGKEPDNSSAQGDGNEDLGVKVALSILRFYKSEISPLLPKSCRYVPTCSEYSMIAYKKYGVVKGSILTAWRICRCNPLGGSGFDPPRWFDEPSPPEQ